MRSTSICSTPRTSGYPDALAMAREHRAVVERGLRLKHAGVAILELLGGRSVHPVSVRVGGFSRVPTTAELAGLRPELETALREAQEVVGWASALAFPAFEREPALLALRDVAGYAIDTGRITSTDGLDVDAHEWESVFVERQVPWSTALHAQTHDGRRYLLGPSARIVLSADRLHPLAAAALARAGGPEPIRTGPSEHRCRRDGPVRSRHRSTSSMPTGDRTRRPRAGHRWRGARHGPRRRREGSCSIATTWTSGAM
ncbi:MAG: hypothetical protein R3C32_07345 [Chloroflexota bacterium]